MFNILTEGADNIRPSRLQRYGEKIYKFKIYGEEGEDRWEEVGQMEDGTGADTVVVPISLEKTMLDRCEATFHSAST